MPAWKKIKSRIAHRNPWYSVREDDVIRPDGKRGKYFVVDTTNSVAILAIDADEKIYMVRQTRYPANNFKSWELPGGGIPKNKTPLYAAKMELEEETGLRANKWKKLGYFYSFIGLSSEKCYVFLAKDLVAMKNHPEGTEDIIIKKMSLKQIEEMIKSNKLIDGFTITSLHKYF